MPTARSARFLTGSTMRHVVVMTASGMIGLTFMFLVDAITLFWVAQLEVERFLAAISFAWTIQFFTIGFAVAFMIGATALVAKSMGQEDWEKARRQGTAALVWSTLFISLLALLLVLMREKILLAVGARGETLEIASDFLLISIPTLPFMVIGMIGSGILRAEGDALRSMVGTMSTGVVAMIVDPLFILGFDMGVSGAALGISVSRIVSSALVMYFVVVAKDLVARPNREDLFKFAPAFFIIVFPTIFTQIASPVGNIFATFIISDFGEAAVAGWGVMNRVLVVAFGGIFALSGAIGGIIGQNYGALAFERVRSAYRDALIFSTIYVFVVWGILILLTPAILWIFGVGKEAAEIVRAFNFVSAGSFVFAGALYVSNASFNNLGKPVYSTICNWFKDGVLIWPACYFLSLHFGAVGVVYGTGVAWMIAGTLAALWGWRYIEQVQNVEITKS